MGVKKNILHRQVTNTPPPQKKTISKKVAGCKLRFSSKMQHERIYRNAAIHQLGCRIFYYKTIKSTTSQTG
jgi:hypothetical protein